MQVIDEEVANIPNQAAERAESILRENRSKLDTLVEALLEKEVLGEREIIALIGPAVRENGGPNGKPDKHRFDKPTRHEEQAVVGDAPSAAEDA
jgi:hypothetical protein